MAIAGIRAGGFLLMASVALAGCQGFDVNRLDLDIRDASPGALDTSGAALTAAERPQPDENGLITYPTYQVAVARRGDTVGTVAGRLGLEAQELGRFNGLAPDARLDAGAVVALPRRVAPRTAPEGPRDIASIAGGAIDRAAGQGRGAAPALEVQDGEEPVRHQVARGETAFSIARLYGVTPASLAQWNGLPGDLSVREGQQLIIPLVIGDNGAEVVSEPGGGSALPPPPSASSALPEPVEQQPLPASPALEATRTSASAGVAAQPPVAPQTREAPTAAIALRRPVEGSVRAPFSERNPGIDYNAAAGAPVRAAAGGTVAAITRDTDRVPILILRHEGGYLTVYANVQDIRVKRGDTVREGARIAAVRESAQPFLHFELRREVDAIDPEPFFR